MNRREQVVLTLLTVTFVIGMGASYWKRAAVRRQATLSPIGVFQSSSFPTQVESAVATEPVDLNRATPRELDGLPGIGPVLAARIVEYRERRGGFHGVAELRSVSGIGEKRYSALKDLITVGPARSLSDSGR